MSNAQFSLAESQSAFENRSNYDEYYFEDIYENSHLDAMLRLDKASSRQDVIDNIQDHALEKPDLVI